MIEIERLDPEAWERYRDVRLASLHDAPSAFGSRWEVERARTGSEWRERLARRTQFLARDGDRPVGTVGCLPPEDGVVEVVSMWVDPSARGTGVGDLLVEAVVTHALRQGVRTMALWVSEGNVSAEHLYTRHGFERTGRTQPIDDADAARGTEFEMRRSA